MLYILKGSPIGIIINPILQLLGFLGGMMYMMLKGMNNSNDDMGLTGGIKSATGAIKDIKESMEEIDSAQAGENYGERVMREAEARKAKKKAKKKAEAKMRSKIESEMRAEEDIKVSVSN